MSKTAWLSLVRKQGWRTRRGHIDLEDRAHRAALRKRRNADDLLALLSPFTPQHGDKSGLYADFADMELLEDIAAARRQKPYTFSRQVRRQFGLTPTALRREWRLLQALRTLALGNARVAAIAAECGFADQSHLAREVKTSTGLSPAAFRKFAQS